MSWSPKSATDLPQVIVGPILRKVTPSLVSVFVVTKDATPMQLKVYASGNSSPILFSDTQTPVMLGTNVFAILLTATPRPTATLSEGVTYGYNIEWGSEDLTSADVLVKGASGTSPIIYSFSNNSFPIGTGGSAISLPTFVLPPSDINDLWLLHGSCRKPHGEGYDAMPGIDDIINEAVSSSNPKIRPQMLFLTGDQIYADDVADALLHMLMKTADSLMGWSEDFNVPNTPEFMAQLEDDIRDKFCEDGVIFPGGGTDPGGHIHIESAMLPGVRTAHIKNNALFTVEGYPGKYSCCKSHLIELREFTMMYLFAWSDVLWPGALIDFPTFSDVRYLKLSDGSTLNIPEDITTVSIHHFLGFTLSHTVSTKKSKSYDDFDKEIKRLNKFKDGLASVRKVLANIPVYTIIDDHEITDDLFYDQDWYDKCFLNTKAPTSFPRNPYGTQTIRNGLAAYSIFQAWGNTPEQFQSSGTPQETIGYNFLNAVEQVVSMPSSGNGYWETIFSAVTPGFGTETPSPAATGQYNIFATDNVTVYGTSTPVYKIGYYYCYSYPEINFEVIALDTRRNRASRHGDADIPGLINNLSLPYQVKNIATDKKQLSIVITATPVVGFDLAEKAIDAGVGVGYKSIQDADLERWSGDMFFLYDFLFKLITRANNAGYNHRALILTGDVHYSFSKGFELKATNSFMETLPSNCSIIAAAVCSSAFRNQTDDKITGTRFVHDSLPLLSDLLTVELGWKNYSGVKLSISLPPLPHLVVDTDIPSIKTNSTILTSPSPSADFMRVNKMYQSDNKLYVPSVSSAGSTLSDYDSVLNEHKRYCLDTDKKGGKWVVGKNNFGELVFNWASGNHYIQHNLWWREDDWNEMGDYEPITNKATHQIPLEFTL